MPWGTLLSTSHKLELCVHVYYNYNVWKKERSREWHILLPSTLLCRGPILQVWWVFWRTKAADMWTTWEWNRILLLQWMEMLIGFKVVSSHQLIEVESTVTNSIKKFFFHIPLGLFLAIFITVKYNHTHKFMNITKHSILCNITVYCTFIYNLVERINRLTTSFSTFLPH